MPNQKSSLFGYELYPEEDYGELIPSYVGRWQSVLLSGVPYIGKTRFAFYMMQALANGEPFFWKKPLPPARGGYISERPIHSIQRTLRDLGIDFKNDNVIIYSTQELPPDLESLFEGDPVSFVRHIIKKHSLDFLVLDTFGHFMPTSRAKGAAKTIDYGEMVTVMRDYNKIALRLRCTLFLIHHNSKKEDYQNLLSKVSGSNAIVGNTLSTMMMDGASQDKETGRWEATKITIEYHHGAAEPIHMLCNPDGTFTLTDSKSITKEAVPTGPTQVEKAMSVLTAGIDVLLRDVVAKLEADLPVSRQRAYKLLKILAEDERIEYVEGINGKLVRVKGNVIH